MRPVLKLRPPQLPMVDWLIQHERCGLWAGMGIGKSSAELFAIDAMRLMGRIGDSPTLVIGPMRVARDTWPEEVAKWDNFSHMTIIPLTGCTIKERILRLQQMRVRHVDIYTISYELLPWLVEHFLDRWPFRQVVADESDRLKGLRGRKKKQKDDMNLKKAGKGAKRAHALGRVAHRLVKRWVNLTGTPAANGYKDLWGQTWYLDRGQRLGLTYSAFEDRWFRTNPYSRRVELMPHSAGEIDGLLKDIYLTVDSKDYFPLKDPIVTEIKVKLPPAARKIYNTLKRELFAKLETGTEVEIFNQAALTNKCLQAANGAIYTNYPEWERLHDEKIEALESVLHESGGTPLLVAYSFQSDIARIKRAFPGAAELATADGMRAFRSGNAAIGLAHPKSMGHGIDGLQYVTNILVRFGHTWPPGERLQMLERIGPMRQYQVGLDRGMEACNMMVYDIVAAGTLDEDVIDSHLTKCGVQAALLKAMKRQ